MNLRSALTCCLVVVGMLAAPAAQDQRRLGPLVDVDPDSTGTYRLNSTGNYRVTLRIQNNCDWAQDVITEDSRHRDASRTRHVGARATVSYDFTISADDGPGGDAFWLTADHEESISEGKKCLKAYLSEQWSLFWVTVASPVIPNGKLTAAPLLVLNQEGGGSTTTRVTPAAPAAPATVPSTGLEFPDFAVPNTDKPINPEDIFGGPPAPAKPVGGGVRTIDPIMMPVSTLDFGAADDFASTNDFGGSDMPIATATQQKTVDFDLNVDPKTTQFGIPAADPGGLPSGPRPPGAALIGGFERLVRKIVVPVHAAGAEMLTLEQAVASGGLKILMTDRGGSTGRTLVAQVLNLTGKPIRLTGSLAVEPLAKQAQQEATRAFVSLAGKAVPTTLDLSAYCVEFLKLPPVAGQVWQVAGPEAQRRLKPLKQVMSAANRLRGEGRLHPDGNPEGYGESIKQWALWTVEQKFSEKKFGEAFLGHTRKNVEGAGQKWTKEFEEIVKQRTPNRWQDIVAILRDAKAPIPQ
jgi:hypothetical protein